MKLFFRNTFKVILTLTILAGCTTTQEIKETDPVALLNQGKDFDEKGQYDRAIGYYNKVIEINPRFTEAYKRRAGIYVIKGKYDKAISDCNKAIEINPRYTEAYNYRGLAYAYKGQYDKGISDYSKAIEINPRFAMAYSNRGVAMMKLGNTEKACSDWKRACELGSCGILTILKMLCHGV